MAIRQRIKQPSNVGSTGNYTRDPVVGSPARYHWARPPPLIKLTIEVHTMQGLGIQCHGSQPFQIIYTGIKINAMQFHVMTILVWFAGAFDLSWLKRGFLLWYMTQSGNKIRQWAMIWSGILKWKDRFNQEKFILPINHWIFPIGRDVKTFPIQARGRLFRW